MNLTVGESCKILDLRRAALSRLLGQMCKVGEFHNCLAVCSIARLGEKSLLKCKIVKRASGRLLM